MDDHDDRWTDWDAGPVARPYTVTGGRTRPRGQTHLDLVDIIVRTPKSADITFSSPERSRILELCRVPTAVPELAAAVGLPLGVVRVVLGDLLHENLIEVIAAAPRGRVTDVRLLRKVLEGLRSLLCGDLIDQTPAQRGRGGQPVAGEHQPRGALPPDPARHAHRAPGAWD
jgi:hypothetical protein